MSLTRAQQTKIDKKFMAAKIALGVIGAGAGFLYKGPGEICIKNDGCGLWLANAITPEVAQGVFTAGGLDYSIINAYMSFNSLDRLKSYLDKKNSTKEKIGKGALVVLFGISLNTGLLLTTFTTSSVWWESTLTTLGGLPGSLYAAVGMTEKQIPMALEASQHGFLLFKKHVVDRLVSPTAYELAQRDYIERYRHQKHHFTKNLRRNLNYRKRHYTDFPSMESNPLVSLAQQIDAYKPSTARKIVRGSTQTLGSLIGIYISSVFAKNTYSNSHRFVPITPLAVVIAGLLSVPSFYNNITITGHGAKSFADLICDGLTDTTPEQLSASFRPKTTAMMSLIALTMSVFSYAVINLIFSIEFPNPDDNPVRDDLRLAADVSICLYHLFGIMHFWETIYSLLSKQGPEQALAHAEALVSHLETMTLEEFMAYVSSNTEDLNGKLSLINYPKPTPDEHPDFAYDAESNELIEDAPHPQPARGFGLFSCCKRNDEKRKLLERTTYLSFGTDA